MTSAWLDPKSLLQVPFLDQDDRFDISSRTGQIAYTHNATGQWQVYVLELAGGSTPRRISEGPGARKAPRWSPCGRRLAYGLDLEGSENFDIWVYDTVTHQHTNLTPGTDDAIQPDVSWSPDGSQIAFLSDRLGSFAVFRMPASGGSPVLAAQLPAPAMQVEWSADSNWLAVVTVGSGQDFETYLVPLPAGDPRLIADKGAPVHAQAPCWSHDSSRVLFSGYRESALQVGWYELESGRTSWVMEGQSEMTNPVWDSRSGLVVAEWNDGPSVPLAWWTPGTQKPRPIEVEHGTHAWPRLTPDGKQVVFVFHNPRHPPDLWSFSLGDGSLHRLTDSLPEALHQAPFVMPEQISFPSFDGKSVPALLYRAPRHGSALAPAVIVIHGGPDWRTSIAWDPSLQHMLSRGWSVLAPNYRGSTGFGRSWQWANRFDMGGKDAEDIAAGADYLREQGLADPNRIAVTGASYGGYLTMVALTRFPDRWAAGSAVVPFLNWLTCFAKERQDLQHWDRENMGDPQANRDLLRARSPFYALDRIQAPVQLICGAHDPRCPASESQQAHDALVSLAKTCDLVLYPDEGHHLLKTANRVDACQRQIAFLAEALEQGAS